MNKKGKKIAQTLSTKDSDMSPLFLDTTCNKECGSFSWEAMYQFFENEKPIGIDKVASEELYISSDPADFDFECSFIHKLATRLKVLPYTYMVKWEINHLNIKYKTFKGSRSENIGSFTTNDLKTMYHLPDPQKTMTEPLFKALEKSTQTS